jgi:hypothetical protein
MRIRTNRQADTGRPRAKFAGGPGLSSRTFFRGTLFPGTALTASRRASNPAVAGTSPAAANMSFREYGHSMNTSFHEYVIP